MTNFTKIAAVAVLGLGLAACGQQASDNTELSANENAPSLIEQAQNAASNASDSIQNAANSATETIQNTADAATSTLNSAVEATQQAAADATNATTEAASDAANATEQAADDAAAEFDAVVPAAGEAAATEMNNAAEEINESLNQ